jgi:hypothetical protein
MALWIEIYTKIIAQRLVDCRFRSQAFVERTTGSITLFCSRFTEIFPLFTENAAECSRPRQERPGQGVIRRARTGADHRDWDAPIFRPAARRNRAKPPPVDAGTIAARWSVDHAYGYCPRSARRFADHEHRSVIGRLSSHRRGCERRHPQRYKVTTFGAAVRAPLRRGFFVLRLECPIKPPWRPVAARLRRPRRPRRA